jgi:hypothetical protein
VIESPHPDKWQIQPEAFPSFGEVVSRFTRLSLSKYLPSWKSTCKHPYTAIRIAYPFKSKKKRALRLAFNVRAKLSLLFYLDVRNSRSM